MRQPFCQAEKTLLGQCTVCMFIACWVFAVVVFCCFVVVLVVFAVVVVFRCFSMHPKDSIQVLFLVLFFNGSF